MATYAIGDLQGCLEPFERLLAKIRFDPGSDTLWLAGDLVNRGGKSLDVLRKVRALGDACVCVLGNHDLHLLAMAAGNPEKKPNAEFERILAAEDGADILHWLRHRPLLHHDANLAITMVHAGIEPRWNLAAAQARANELETALRGPDHQKFFTAMYGNSPTRWTDKLTGQARLRTITNIFTRMRFVAVGKVARKHTLNFDHNGPPGSQPKGWIPWYAMKNRAMAGQLIVFGHWSALGAYVGKDVYGVDSGCVWGNSLTALRLDGEREFTQVDCERPKG